LILVSFLGALEVVVEGTGHLSCAVSPCSLCRWCCPRALSDCSERTFCLSTPHTLLVLGITCGRCLPCYGAASASGTPQGFAGHPAHLVAQVRECGRDHLSLSVNQLTTNCVPPYPGPPILRPRNATGLHL
jgi:hypothetical protein